MKVEDWLEHGFESSEMVPSGLPYRKSTLSELRFDPKYVEWIKYGHDRLDTYFWCQQNCKGRYAVHGAAAFFLDVDDAILFKLTWS